MIIKASNDLSKAIETNNHNEVINIINNHKNKEEILTSRYDEYILIPLLNYAIENKSYDVVKSLLNYDNKKYTSLQLKQMDTLYNTPYMYVNELLRESNNENDKINYEKIIEIIETIDKSESVKLIYDKVSDINIPILKKTNEKYRYKDEICIPYVNENGEKKIIAFYINYYDYTDKDFPPTNFLLDTPNNPGVYCWILYTDTKKNQKFKCIKVDNRFELNSEHSIIIQKLDDINYVNMAGELYYDGKKICYNFLSGTFMRELFTTYSYKIDYKEIEKDFNKIIGKIINKNIEKCEHDLETLINDNLAPITKENLDTYTKIGKIHIVDNESECKRIYDYYKNKFYHDICKIECNKPIFKKIIDINQQLVNDTLYKPEEFVNEESTKQNIERIESQQLRRSERIANKKNKFGIRKYTKKRSLRKNKNKMVLF